MKLISDDLVNDLQVLIDNAIHLRHTWAQVAQVKRALAELEDGAQEPPGRPSEQEEEP